jgi:hypothetical protein
MCYVQGKENKMKKIIICIVILCLAAASGFAQVNLNQYKKGIEDFADDLATILPMNSAIGLNWNDAYIGQLLDVPPHFGIGVTAGVVNIPYGPVKNLVEDAMDGDSSDIPSFVKTFGVPIPAYTIDARIGGFMLPFDIGLKFGYLNLDISDVQIDYLLLGGDVRYCVLEQTVLIPKVSVGAGFNYMKTNATMSGALGSGMTIDTTASSSQLGGVTQLDFSTPDLYLEMKTKVLDFKAQASWSALIFEPSIGLGASYGMSEVSAGAESTMSVTGGSATVDDVVDGLNGLGYDVGGAKLGYTKKVNAMSYRLFGGLGFNLAVLRLDLGFLYGINSGSWGATVGARFQM